MSENKRKIKGKPSRFKRKVESSQELTPEEWERINREYFGDSMEWGTGREYMDDEFDEDGNPKEVEF